MNWGMSIFVWVGVVLIVIIVAVWAFSLQNPLPSATQTSATSTSSSTGSGASGTHPPAANASTFHSILTQTGSHQCNYELISGGTKSSDVVDVANGKLYGEFRTTDPAGNSDNSIMVYDGRYLYVWKEGKTTGTRTVLSSLAQLPQAIPANMTGAAIFGSSYQNVSWDCHPWLTDKTKLAPPTYVKFTSA